MKTTLLSTMLVAVLAAGFCAQSAAATIGGDPSADAGWSLGGNSLANGVYVRGEGTFSFDIYSAAFAVAGGSNLDITAGPAGQYSWLPGDQVLGLGGKFVPTDAVTAGWPAFTPNPYVPANGDGLVVNDDISGSTRPVGKFGAATSNFTVSTTAPFLNGNGNGSQEAGHGGDGGIMMRVVNNVTAGNAGTIRLLDRIDRYDAAGGLPISTSSDAGIFEDDDFVNVGRMMYQYSGGAITSWEYLLNVSLMQREFPYGVYPTAGDEAIMAVQRSNNRFVDGLINDAVVPEPGSLALAGLALAGLVAARRRAVA